MKKLTLSLLSSIIFFSSTAMAESGKFCNPKNHRVEWVCNATPNGPGWVNMGNNCYHRDTGMSCAGHGGGGGHNSPYFPPSHPGAGRVECRANDKGWEEHGSHHSCGECLREHDNCRETCSVTEYRCEAQGIDHRGFTVNFTGQGRDRYRAEDSAMRNCTYNAGRCRITRCNTNEDVVSRRDCR